MGVHHIVNEDDQMKICVYCGNNLSENKWKSVFLQDFHYKTTNCKCGKKAFLKINFLGSGHDKWKGKDSECLEKLKKDMKKKQIKKDKGTIKTIENLVTV